MNAYTTWTKAIELSETEYKDRDDAVEASSKRSSHSLVLMFSGACLAVAATLSVATVVTWRPLQELREIDRRLSALDGVEHRLGDHFDSGLDRVDTSVASRIGAMGETVTARFDQIDLGLRGLQTGLGDLHASVEDSAGVMLDTGARMDEAFAAAVAEIAQLADTVSTDVASSLVAAGPGPDQGSGLDPLAVGSIDPAGSTRATPSTRFERQELPDGSVAYRLK
ncbi:hypothetical protein [Consotaella aegiceratis]|uniref:hypothetical protein n=1 Tax=Consotaella aegiceratis TaxID=3097961 RepID=UPI002F413CD9